VSLVVPSGVEPVAYCEWLMAERGVVKRCDLRQMHGVPRGRWIVKTEAEREGENGCDPLICAAVLGLSGSTFYSDERPIVWTRERLSRSISLHRLGGFYAN
jgi:hypothetical protein